MPASPLQLKVQKIEQHCLFELSWGQGQQKTAQLAYPPELTRAYEHWQRSYINFYTTMNQTSPQQQEDIDDHETGFRGRSVKEGSFTPKPINLREAELQLLEQFHAWFRSEELFAIRTTIFQETNSINELPLWEDDAPPLERTRQRRRQLVYLSCMPLELARLPWETWDGTACIQRGQFGIVRVPANIVMPARPQPGRRHRRRARVLAILGAGPGLNFETEVEAIKSLGDKVEVTFVGLQMGQPPQATRKAKVIWDGWQPQATKEQICQHICRAISDEAGWDVLFFAGHSNETPSKVGELEITPEIKIHLNQIEDELMLALSRGLQVAVFNSCSGLNIAESLVSLGFSQVAIMREPIHNKVAQEYLVEFLRHLTAYRDVYESMLAACDFLRKEKKFKYPSAYLVPSLFCRPGAPLFQLHPVGWQHWLSQSLPTRLEAIALALGLTLSLIPSLQGVLLDQRVATQAAYRNLTGQIPAPAPAPVALVQVDNESITRDPRLANPSPINRLYLAELINQLAKRQVSILGIDYLLDRSTGSEPMLRQTIQSVVQQHQSWVVFGTLFEEFESQNRFVTKASGISDRTWTLQGYVSQSAQYVTLPYPEEDCRQTCPLAYLLSLIHTAKQTIPSLPPPNLDSRTDLRTQLLNTIASHNSQHSSLQSLQRSRLPALATWAYDTLGLHWFEPIVDYSIPPDRIYNRIAAWRLLADAPDFPNLPNQVVIIGAGEYTDTAGAVTVGSLSSQLDLYPVPSAVSYWRQHLPRQNHAAAFSTSHSENSPDYLPVLTGAEIHAYMVHHLLTQRLVVPIPDFCLVLLAALFSKIILMFPRQKSHPDSPQQFLQNTAELTLLSAGYGLITLQAYLSAGILLPYVLPTLMVWVYVLPASRKKSHV